MAESTGAEPFRGVVMLQDGGLLQGAIAQTGDRYIVTSADSEINVPAANVVFVCRSIEEAYERQRPSPEGQDADAHLKLAAWCLRHQLTSQAADELAEARRIDSRHPKLALLERRLALAREPRRAAAPADGRASASKPAPPRPAMRRSEQSRQYRILVSELPSGAVERFTRKVQPLLVNSCTTSGCHAPQGEQQFQLDRSLLHGMANRRTTMHNLSAALDFVDRKTPEESPLLTISRRAHGGMTEPVFGPFEQKLYEQLAEWVTLVTRHQDAHVEAPSEAEGEWTMHPGADAAAQLERAGAMVDPLTVTPLVAPLRRPLPGARQPTSVVPSAAYDLMEPIPQKGEFLDEGATLRPPSQLRVGARLRPVEPRDEFDPEIFNQQFRK